MTVQFLPVLWERGALGRGSFVGGLADAHCDLERMLDFHRKHDLYLASIGSYQTLLDGPESAIEDEVRELLEFGKPYPRFSVAIGMVDYWTPQAHLDAAIAAAKRHGRY